MKNEFKVDLSKLKGEGDFPCPNCGAKISPDDPTENTYTILDAEVTFSSDDFIFLECKCGAKIRLIGFNDLEKVKQDA